MASLLHFVGMRVSAPTLLSSLMHILLGKLTVKQRKKKIINPKHISGFFLLYFSRK